MNAYYSFCKPMLAKALCSVGMDKIFHRAKGAHLYYRNGKEERQILDLLGGYGAVLMGHNHPHLIEKAIRLLTGNTPFHNQFSIRNGSALLAEELNPILRQETGWNEDFLMAFTNTGAESVEVALKHAEFMRGKKLEQLKQRLSAKNGSLSLTDTVSCSVSDKDRDILQIRNHLSLREIDEAVLTFNTLQLARSPIFIALKHSFHGKLTGSVQLTYGEIYRHPFRRFNLGVRFINPDDVIDQIEHLMQVENAWGYELALNGRCLTLERVPLPLIGAVIVEPVQGEGGVHCLTDTQAEKLNAVRDKWMFPLISDEVQSGCGRCGSFLAGSQIGLKPDYVILSKALGGGISKLGVVAIRKGAYAQGFDLIQSSTFGEDDYSSLIAVEYVRLLQENEGALYKSVLSLGRHIKQKLQALKIEFPDIISDVRGKGLLLGLEMTDQSGAHSHILKTVAYQGTLGYLLSGHLLNEAGIRVAPPASASNVIRIEPSIQTSLKDIEHLIKALKGLCLALRYQDAHYILRFLTWTDDTPAPGKPPRDYRAYYSAPDFSISLADNMPGGVTKVAFINHLISAEWLKQVDPSFADILVEEADRLLNRMAFDRRSAPFRPVRITSLKGHSVDFILYPLTVTSAQVEKMMAGNDLEEIRNAIDERIATAYSDGCEVAGLGMFTSIVTNNAKSVRVPGVNLTTGNSLTVAMAVRALKETINEKEIHPRCGVVIGAAGNIGSVYSSILGELVPRLILVGSGRKGSSGRLRRTEEKLYEDCWKAILTQPDAVKTGVTATIYGLDLIKRWLTDPSARPGSNIGQAIRLAVHETFPGNPPITVSDHIEAIKEADVIICTANASEAFVDPLLIKKNALVCDVAVPHNLSQELLSKRPDIVCIRGGIVGTPHNESLDPRTRAFLRKGEVYACMAETAVLGFEGYRGHYSYGNLNKEQVHTIHRMAESHGFTLSSVKTGESM